MAVFFFFFSFDIVYQFLNSWDNIARVITLGNVVLDAPENTAQKNNPIQCCFNNTLEVAQETPGNI